MSPAPLIFDAFVICFGLFDRHHAELSGVTLPRPVLQGGDEDWINGSRFVGVQPHLKMSLRDREVEFHYFEVQE